MNNLKELIGQLKKLNIKEDKFILFGSAPMAVRGLKEAHDLDVIVKKDIWKDLIKKYPIEKTAMGNPLIRIGDIEIFEDWAPWFKNVDILFKDCDIINGIRYVKLKYVIQWKETYSRDKDKKDVALIKDYEKNMGEKK